MLSLSRYTPCIINIGIQRISFNKTHLLRSTQVVPISLVQNCFNRKTFEAVNQPINPYGLRCLGLKDMRYEVIGYKRPIPVTLARIVSGTTKRETLPRKCASFKDIADHSLLQFAHALTTNQFMHELEALMAINEFTNKIAAEREKTVRVWFDQEHTEWQKITFINLQGDKEFRLTELSGEMIAILKRMTNLKWLNLAHNQLSTLPETIGCLTRLQCLDLSHNKLTTLPARIGNLTQLIELFLTDNKLTSLPDTIDSLVQLVDLRLEKNKLTSLPATIGNLPQLLEIHLKDNKFATLPDTIGRLVLRKRFSFYEKNSLDWFYREHGHHPFYKNEDFRLDLPPYFT